MNIWTHIGFYQAGPIIYKLAEEQGMLADKYVWISHELLFTPFLFTPFLFTGTSGSTTS